MSPDNADLKGMSQFKAFYSAVVDPYHGRLKLAYSGVLVLNIRCVQMHVCVRVYARAYLCVCVNTCMQASTSASYSELAVNKKPSCLSLDSTQ